MTWGDHGLNWSEGQQAFAGDGLQMRFFDLGSNSMHLEGA